MLKFLYAVFALHTNYIRIYYTNCAFASKETNMTQLKLFDNFKYKLNNSKSANFKYFYFSFVLKAIFILIESNTVFVIWCSIEETNIAVIDTGATRMVITLYDLLVRISYHPIARTYTYWTVVPIIMCLDNGLVWIYWLHWPFMTKYTFLG